MTHHVLCRRHILHAATAELGALMRIQASPRAVVQRGEVLPLAHHWSSHTGCTGTACQQGGSRLAVDPRDCILAARMGTADCIRVT